MDRHKFMLPVRLAMAILRGMWLAVQFTGALLYYLITEIFADPFIAVKPIKIAAQWLYKSCHRFPVIALYFNYLVRPEGKAPVFQRLSQIPWAVAPFPAVVVAVASSVKLLALSMAVSHPVLAVCVFVGAKIVLVPVALRMWDEIRLVVRKDIVLRQVDNVVSFLFHDLPVRAKAIVQERMAQVRRLLAPIRERMRALTRPVREWLHPLTARVREIWRAWVVMARAWMTAVRESVRAFFSRRPSA